MISKKIEVSPISTMVRMTLSDALVYCLFLEVDGKRDWRLPHASELFHLVNSVNEHKPSGFAHWTTNDSLDDYETKSNIAYWVRAVRDKTD
jgi:hypothetical protein